MAGMSFRELDCEHDWCRVGEAIQWSGPGVEGYWINPNQEKVPLNLQPPRGTPSTLSAAGSEEMYNEVAEEEEHDEEEGYELEEEHDVDEEWDEDEDEEEWEEEL
jgi:hypothetical protein